MDGSPEAEGHGPVRDSQAARLLRPHFVSVRFPSTQIVGYATSLVLTLLALGLTAGGRLPPAALIPTILGLAAIQAGVQLSCFMHLRESRGPAWQLPTLALALGIGIGIVGFTIWIMAFKSGVS